MMPPVVLARLKQDAGTAQKCHPPVKGNDGTYPKNKKRKNIYTVEEKAPDNFSEVKEGV